MFGMIKLFTQLIEATIIAALMFFPFVIYFWRM
jgi:hypothetical protein